MFDSLGDQALVSVDVGSCCACSCPLILYNRGISPMYIKREIMNCLTYIFPVPDFLM